MKTCPACGHPNPDGAKFCAECGRAVAEAPAPAREERKVVTVLFADLVGFTSRAEQLDPEDVRGLLSPYYARLRSELERFGGTVEKFIGDAVMALFGAPVAHEDDPERAVRAALAIRDWVIEQEGELQLRIAVTTGEALVSLGARPGEGEGMASGDVVNTTARLQAAAPVNGILVGESTYRATSQVIDYHEAEPVVAKGKTEPVRVWEAVQARARFGTDLARSGGVPMVGRTAELALLTDALARAQRDLSPQLVTVVGEPGIGKSRLVAELFRAVDEDPDIVVHWRQGRSLPYGDGISFWALGEMVKAQTGILETDPPEVTEEKLQRAVGDVVADEADAQWIVGHLRPLAGIGGGSELGGDRRAEAFTAWRRFFEALAEQRPLTLVFEDLHWAGDNLLDFVEHLVDWAVGVPLLVVCLARPELLERRAAWGGGKRNAATLSLSRLSDEETARLIGGLTGRPVLAVETQQALLSRAGGNPLYAEQFVRMLDERGAADELPLPETVQGIIAARLDALPVEEKSLLQGAAVLGKVFWLGAVSEVGAIARSAAEVRLHALERKDFVQRMRRSSVAGEAEYAFLHVLVRDVVYGQIPRAQRAEKHRLAAEWIGSLGRTEDHAEMLAHHYLSALELRRASGQSVDGAFSARVLESAREAGERAFALNAYASAARYYQAALELAPSASLERARVLFRFAATRQLLGEGSSELFAAARDGLLAGGDTEAAAEAEAALGALFWIRGERDRAFQHLGRARALVEEHGPSRAKASVLASSSRLLMLAAEDEDAIRVGREALAMAEQLGLDEVRAHALDNIGCAKAASGDLSGLDDLELSATIAEAATAPRELCRARANLAAMLWSRGELGRAYALWVEQGEIALRFGQIEMTRWNRGVRTPPRFVLGRWDEALAAADEFLAEVEAGAPHYLAPDSHATRAHIRLARGDVPGALADTDRALELARLTKDPQSLFSALARCAHVLRECGRLDRAAVLADEVVAAARGGTKLGAAVSTVHVLAWTLSALGRGAELIDALPADGTPWVRAAAAFAAGDLRGAADVCGSMGAVSEEARDRLWLAEALAAQGRRAEAEVELGRALAFYRTVGARRYVREGEGLLAESA